jgi:hypothetical protein
MQRVDRLTAMTTLTGTTNVATNNVLGSIQHGRNDEDLGPIP